jgi:diguanylate cyclase (GGDEF)-like protein
LITLAAGESIAAVRVPPGVFLSQFALFLIAVPFARMWSFNPWLSIFSLAPVVMSYRLLQLPELEYRATTDGRTGLKNAEAFDRILSDAVEASVSTGRDLVLLAIDIDHFKSINDTYGHLVGDGVIAGFAGILAGQVRKDDVVARTGGEEFALLMQGADRDNALAFAERVRERIEAHDFEGIGLAAPIKVTASIGVASFPSIGRSVRAVTRSARPRPNLPPPSYRPPPGTPKSTTWPPLRGRTFPKLKFSETFAVWIGRTPRERYRGLGKSKQGCHARTGHIDALRLLRRKDTQHE